MSDNIKILKNYLLYFSTFLLLFIVGISGVFADEVLNSNSFFSVTGRRWSISPTEYTEASPILVNNWAKHAWNVPSGIYTPPNSFDYVTLSYFQHNGNYNPCSSGNYRVSFSLKFSTPVFTNYVRLVQFADNNCSIVADSSTGIITANCPVTYSSSSGGVWASVWYNEISGNSSSDLYISKDINVSCSLNTDAITDNATQNTQNIINNNNSNTQIIIDNQNQNTQDMIESQKVCTDIDINNIVTPNSALNSSGAVTNSSNYGITDYISLSSSSDLTIFIGSGYNSNMCYYTSNKSLISCFNYNSINAPDGLPLTIPQNASYFRASINNRYNRPTFKLCKNGNQVLDDSINNLNDSLNDDNTTGAESEASEFFSSFDTETFGLTSIITAPLNLIQSLTSSTCIDLELPLPYLDNKKLTLPCMSSIYQQYFGTFFSIYQTITYGIIAYWVCVRIFNQVKDFKNPEHDEIEVVDL